MSLQILSLQLVFHVCRLIMPEQEQNMPGELLKVFPHNNLQMMFLSGAKGTQVSILLNYLFTLKVQCNLV